MLPDCSLCLFKNLLAGLCAVREAVGSYAAWQRKLWSIYWSKCSWTIHISSRMRIREIKREVLYLQVELTAFIFLKRAASVSPYLSRRAEAFPGNMTPFILFTPLQPFFLQWQIISWHSVKQSISAFCYAIYPVSPIIFTKKWCGCRFSFQPNKGHT